MVHLQVATKHLFLDGPRGTRKTLVYRCLIQSCINSRTEIILVAWTEIAAMLLPRSHRIHMPFRGGWLIRLEPRRKIRVAQNFGKTKEK